MQRTPTVGSVFSRYKVVEQLGQGGMGAVYKAVDLRLERYAALKFLALHLSTDESSKLRFIQEAKAASALDHPNVCTIYGIEEIEDDQLFIAMAYYDGETLRSRMARGPIAIEEAVNIAIQVGDGLAAAHERGIVHRDIKPANLILTREGIVKIVDFGLAILGGNARITSPGVAVGTVAYMSPEQARGAVLDFRTDIWSLGVVLYEMITGQRPFHRQHDQAIVFAILNEAPPPMSRLRPGVPPALEEIAGTALAKDPSRRHPSIRHFASELRRFAGLPSGSGSTLPARVPSGFTDVTRTITGPGSAHSSRRPPSIAVLAFANLNRDEESEYFSDGLADELITALAQVDGLRVVSRTSAFEFKGKSLDIRKIGEQLNVNTVLEGSVRRAGNRLRISAQLVNTADGYQIWSQRYDREMKDIFAIQDEIAQTIVSTLKVKLSESQEQPLVRPRTENLVAYHLYLKGRYYWHRQTEEGLQKAFEHFTQAIEEDPNFAPAHAILADYYIAVGFWSVMPPDEVWPKAKEAALRALEIDDSFPQVHISVGYVKIFCDWAWSDAGQCFQRAVELGPSDPNARYARSVYLVQMGATEEAIAEMKRALELDPLSLSINTALAYMYFYGGYAEETIRQAQATLEMSPDYFEVQIVLGMAQMHQGRHEEAVRTFEHVRVLSADNPLILGFLGSACAMTGDRDRAMQILDQLDAMEKQRYVIPVARVLIHIGLGDKDRAFEWLERSADARDALLCYMNVLPILEPLRSDPRFAAVQEKIGLSQFPSRTR